MATYNLLSLVLWLLSYFNAIRSLPLTNDANVTTEIPQLEVPDVATGRFQCEDSDDWSSAWFHPSDCDVAIHSLYENAVLLYGRMTQEFVSSGATPTVRVNWQRTPMRFSAGTCTVTIALLQDLQRVLPVTAHSQNGFDDYWTIWKAAKALRTDCLSPYLALNDSHVAVTRSVSPNFRSRTGWVQMVSLKYAASYCC